MKIDKKLVRQINEITRSKSKTRVSEEDVIWMLEELVSEVYRLEEQYEDFREYVRDNYRPISYEEQIDYNEEDFIELL